MNNILVVKGVLAVRIRRGCLILNFGGYIRGTNSMLYFLFFAFDSYPYPIFIWHAVDKKYFA